ncbi:hypothetical protein L7F22_032590 [Adiantum nelumboides]|nr:hypothetical protein [Adiantum nelumboides]
MKSMASDPCFFDASREPQPPIGSEKIGEIFDLVDFEPDNVEVEIKPNIHEYKLDHLSWTYHTNVFEQRGVCKKFKHTGADVQGVIKPYQKPQLLMMDLIDLLSMRGKWVMDLFAGTCTTTVSALKQGQNVIAMECDPLQVKFIEQRVTPLKELLDEFQEVGMKSMASNPCFFDAFREPQPPIDSEKIGEIVDLVDFEPDNVEVEESNQISAQSTQLGDHSDVAKAIIFASFFDLLGQHEITNSMHASTYQDRAENEQKSKYPELEDDPKTMSEGLDSNSDVTQQTPGFLHFAMQGPSSKPDEGMFTNVESYFSQMEDRTYFLECQQELAEMQDIDSEFFEVFMEFLATENDCESARIEEEFIDLFVLPPNSNFYDVFAKELEQTNVGLPNLSEDDTNIQFHSFESFQIEPQEDQINYLLNLKIQENRFLEPNANFVAMYPCSMVMQMLKKHCLMVAQMFFYIVPILGHYEMKSELLDVLFAANWWLKLIMEMCLSGSSLFSKSNIADIQYFGDFQDQISMSEVYFADFLNVKVANHILQTRDVEADDSMIHISYCLNQIL